MSSDYIARPATERLEDYKLLSSDWPEGARICLRDLELTIEVVRRMKSKFASLHFLELHRSSPADCPWCELLDLANRLVDGRIEPK